MHFHLDWELFHQISGASLFQFPQQQLLLQKGETLIVPIGAPHVEQIKKLPFQNLVIGHSAEGIHYHEGIGEQMNMPPVSHDPSMFSGRHQDSMGQLCQQLIQDLPHKAKQHLISAYLACLIDSPQIPSPYQSLTVKDPLIDLCLIFVHQHFDRPDINVKLLAKWAGCTPNHLSAQFSKVMHCGLHQYITDLRIDRAKKVLLNQTSVACTASVCGYSNTSNFVQTFKKQLGMTPKQFALSNSHLARS